jgi:flagellar biosynthesis GTPase FlhF
MAAEINSTQSSGGVRTYRGRTIDEILPQIRAELGPDAIILREREGLVGGVGGFFAQRFVEVDARRGDGQSIDIYDDSPESDFALPVHEFDDDPIETCQAPAFLPPEPVELGRRPPMIEPPAPAPMRFVPPSIEPEPPAPTRRFETEVFMARLREASKVLPDDGDDYEPIDAVPKPDPEAVVRERPRPIEPELEPEPEPEPKAEAKAPARRARQTKPRPERAERKPRQTPPERKPRASRRRPEPEPEPVAKQDDSLNWSDALLAPDAPLAPRPVAETVAEVQPVVDAQPQPVAATQPAMQAQPAAETQPVPAAQSQEIVPAAAPMAPEPTADNPYVGVRRRPNSLRDALASTPAPAPIPVPAPATPAPAPMTTARQTPTFPVPATSIPPTAPPPAVVTREHHDDGFLGAIARIFTGRRQDTMPHPAPAKPIDTEAAAAAITDLSARGASQAWASQLITAVGAHGAPLAPSLRVAAEAEVARRILPPPTLPITGAAIAFIGAGGSGKTRCTAALASAYRRGSTLAVSVIALDNPEGARELKRLLRDDDVPVLSLSSDRADQAIAAAREGGLVIVDTPAATPTDGPAIRALGQKLSRLGLDAVYVALPATLGPQAARRALASFGSLSPTAVAITHADETDQLAVVIEIAIAHRIPLAYVHSGTDHKSALSSVDPKEIAHHLLP